MPVRAELFNDLGVVDPVDVDPCDGRRVLEREAFLDRAGLPFEKAVRVVIHDRDPRFSGLLVADVHEGSRRQSRLLRAFDLFAGHVVLLADFYLRIDRFGAIIQRIGGRPAGSELWGATRQECGGATRSRTSAKYLRRFLRRRERSFT
jgi:hypothetical protein